jgi:hypothetical protein
VIALDLVADMGKWGFPRQARLPAVIWAAVVTYVTTRRVLRRRINGRKTAIYERHIWRPSLQAEGPTSAADLSQDFRLGTKPDASCSPRSGPIDPALPAGSIPVIEVNPGSQVLAVYPVYPAARPSWFAVGESDSRSMREE